MESCSEESKMQAKIIHLVKRPIFDPCSQQCVYIQLSKYKKQAMYLLPKLVIFMSSVFSTSYNYLVMTKLQYVRKSDENKSKF